MDDSTTPEHMALAAALSSLEAVRSHLRRAGQVKRRYDALGQPLPSALGLCDDVEHAIRETLDQLP
jgi:hypothetical protein